jgi:hypothetical protein
LTASVVRNVSAGVKPPSYKETAMDSPNVVPFEKTRLSAGVKAIAVVIALTSIALVADHAYFVAPHAHAHAAVPATQSEMPITVQVDGFLLPEILKPTAADVTSPAPTF